MLQYFILGYFLFDIFKRHRVTIKYNSNEVINYISNYKAKHRNKQIHLSDKLSFAAQAKSNYIVKNKIYDNNLNNFQIHIEFFIGRRNGTDAVIEAIDILCMNTKNPLLYADNIGIGVSYSESFCTVVCILFDSKFMRT